jgi:uncharacterized protein YciI
MHYLLFYHVRDDYVECRQPYRRAHLTLAQEYVARGELILGGALDEPVDQAVLLFRVDDPKTIEAFVQRDPYVQQGLVQTWQIRKWLTVVGSEACVAVPAEMTQAAMPPDGGKD